MHDCHSLLKESVSTMGLQYTIKRTQNRNELTVPEKLLIVIRTLLWFSWMFFFMLWWLWVKISSKSVLGGMVHVWTSCILTQRVQRRTVNYPILTLTLSAWRCCNASACEACAVADARWISWAQGVKSSCGSEGSPDAHSPLINFLSSIMKCALSHRHRAAQVNLSSGSPNRLLQEFINVNNYSAELIIYQALPFLQYAQAWWQHERRCGGESEDG